MSDLNPVLEEGFGTPLVWLFSPFGAILRDYDEVPISKYLSEFEYTYSEEDDDTATLKFKFESLRSFDLPYFQQDVILHVQWGYITTNRKFIKSPVRKIAVRDINSTYKADGIELELKCTDLISYLKNYQTKTIMNYSGTDKFANKANNIAVNNLLDWLKEEGAGKFSTTITKSNVAMRIDQIGNQRVAQYDNKTNTYSAVQDNNRVKKEFNLGFQIDKVIHGNGNSFKTALKAQLKLMSDKWQEENAPMIVDSTDDTLEIKARNFNQNIYKAYTYNGGSGELLSFNSNTNTRKEKKDISASSGVNPYKKQIESLELTAAETKNKGSVQTEEKWGEPQRPKVSPGKSPAYDFKNPKVMSMDEKAEANKKISKTFEQRENKPSKETLKAWLKEVEAVRAFNFENPENMKPMPPLRYSYTKYTNDYYMGSGGTKEVVVSTPAKTIINTPEFQSVLRESISTIKSDFKRQNVLTGYTIERIQRKYEASMEVIGDPSLIKGKIIYVNNLGRLDRGKWYISTCKHSIDVGKAYTTEMGLMKKPSIVGLHMKKYASNPKFDRASNTLEFEREESANNNYMYEETKEDAKKASDMDNEFINTTREEKEVSMQVRLENLNAEEDFRLGKNNNDLSSNNYTTTPEPNINEK